MSNEGDPMRGDPEEGQRPAEKAAPGAARTGAEQPWDPEDLAMAEGKDPTPENVHRAAKELGEEGPAAIDKTVP
jgi:hypothetical protein